MSCPSSSARSGKNGKLGNYRLLNIPLTNGQHGIRFLCTDLSRNYQPGALRLSKEFVIEYGEQLPSRVYPRLPNGSAWFGTYVPSTERIKNLENFMLYYDIKPYNMIGFQYCGGADFLIELFNCYAVEIDYRQKEIPLQNGLVSHNHLGCDVRKILPPCDFVVDKLCSTLHYNANSTWSRAYEFFILPKHVRKQKYCEVLTLEACEELGLNRTMSWIELCFTTSRWRIQLMWEGSNIYFGEEWFQFIENSSIKPGDLCLLRYTASCQRFDVAIFDKIGMCSILRNVHWHGKGISKFLKLMNHDTVLTGELEIPHLFDLEFSWMLSEDVNLITCDGYEYRVCFLEASKLLIGLKEMLLHYSVKENSVLSFEFLGRSTFYVSIYSTNGMDIFNNRTERLMLQSVAKHLEDDVIVLTESTLGMDTDISDGEVDISENKLVCITESKNDQFGGPRNSFTRTLTGSNLDKNGHGVYFPAEMYQIYKDFDKSDLVTLLHGGVEWDVGVYRFKKQCRFGRGWMNFVTDNNFQVGDKIQFSLGGSIFEVAVINSL